MALSNTQPNGIKSIQRGTVTIASGALSGTATITAVDTQKAELRFMGERSTQGGSIELTNATTITATRTAAPAVTGVLGFEVVERW